MGTEPSDTTTQGSSLPSRSAYRFDTRSALFATLMILGVLIVYALPGLFRQNPYLFGIDYEILHLREASPALPLLLGLVEGLRKPQAAWRQILPLAFAAACVMLCGHPQLPMFATFAAFVYVIWRLRGAQLGRALLALIGGAGIA